MNVICDQAMPRAVKQLKGVLNTKGEAEGSLSESWKSYGQRGTTWTSSMEQVQVSVTEKADQCSDLLGPHGAVFPL